MIIVSFFVNVYPRNDESDYEAIDRLTWVAERYLYPPFVTLGAAIHDVGYARQVRIAVAGLFPDRAQAERRTQAQQDRFSSGLYATSEPTYLTTED